MSNLQEETNAGATRLEWSDDDGGFGSDDGGGGDGFDDDEDLGEEDKTAEITDDDNADDAGDDVAVEEKAMEETKAEEKPATPVVDPKTTVKNMFKMNSKASDPPKNAYAGSNHFMTSQMSAHEITRQSAASVTIKSKIDTAAGASAVLGRDVDPDVLQVSAKRVAKNWQSQQYRDDHQRAQLNVTTNRGNQNNLDFELTEKLRVN